MDFENGSLLGGMDVLSVNLLKYADKNGSEGFRLLGSLLGGWQYHYFSKGLGDGSVVRRNIIWDVVSDVLVTISGIFLWGEQINGTQMMGIGLSLIGIYLMK